MTTWVLLRGLTREARHWEDVPARLLRLLPPGHRVLALDLPGNGLHCHEASPSSIQAMVQALRAELARLRAQRPYVLVALSLGGMVAIEWSCQAAPGEIAGCVLINTSVRGISPFWHRLRPGNYLRLTQILISSSLPRESTVLALTSRMRASDAELARRWAEYAQHRPVSIWNALRQITAAIRYRLPGRTPSVPLLVLASAADGFVSPVCSKALAERWGVPLRLHASAGHDLALDAPDWLVTQCIAWWKEMRQ